MAAADAARLQNDPALGNVLYEIEREATINAIYSDEHAEREKNRQLVVAINMLRSKLQDRIDAVLIREAARRRANASE